MRLLGDYIGTNVNKKKVCAPKEHNRMKCKGDDLFSVFRITLLIRYNFQRDRILILIKLLRIMHAGRKIRASLRNKQEILIIE